MNIKSIITLAVIAGLAAFAPSAQAGFPSSGRYTPSGGGPVCGATNGQLDLSFCSNSFYLATVF